MCIYLQKEETKFFSLVSHFMDGENKKNDDKNDNENDSINEDAKTMKYIINKNNFKRNEVKKGETKWQRPKYKYPIKTN